MNPSLFQIILSLLAGIFIIVLLTTKFRVHAFFALFLACFVAGLGAQLPITRIVQAMKEGFGGVMSSLGLIIVLGTTLGILLDRTGSAQAMARFILRRTNNATWAISLIGFIVGLPVFCDSGYIVLNGLSRSLAIKSRISIPVMSACLATGLYSVHCLVPPHPGITTAAGTIGADIGKLILYGIIIAIPAMIAGHYWARYAGRHEPLPELTPEEQGPAETNKVRVLPAFLPVLIPILLIALRSFLTDPSIASASGWISQLLFVGDPVIALTIGVFLAFLNFGAWKRQVISEVLQDAAEKAGGILVIIGAGGALGAVLAATGIGTQFEQSGAIRAGGILFPFLLAFLLKTAQGSSTVAIITASALVQPLLPALHMDSSTGRILAVLAMGAGSMMISHTNDAYFWAITKFSGLEIRSTLRVYSIATIWMGLVSLLGVFILSQVIS